jgi:hypothetical protein
VLGDVEERAIRGQGVEVEDTGQFDDPWLGTERPLDDREPGGIGWRGAIGAVLDQHDRRAVGRHSDGHRIEPDGRQPPGTVDRPQRAAEPRLDDQILDEAIRSAGGHCDQMTPRGVRDADREFEVLLARAREHHAQHALARPADDKPGVAIDGSRQQRARRRRRGGGNCRRGRRCERPRCGRRARGSQEGDRKGERPSVRPGYGSHRSPASRCAGVDGSAHHPYTERGAAVPGHSSDSAMAIVSSCPRALSIR